MTNGRTLRCFVAVAAVAGLAGCGADDGKISGLEAQVAALDEQLVGVEEAAATLTDERDAAVEQVEVVTAERDAADELASENEERAVTVEAERDAALAAVESMQAERDAAVAESADLRLRYDPEIQAAIASAQQVANDAGCAAGDAFGSGTADLPNADLIVREAIGGLPEGAAVDAAQVQARIDECVLAAQARLAEVALTMPKGDGLWTIGLEMAPGLWRSDGTGDSCYWQRSPDGNPDEITDNHFGNAGGSVTVRPGEEFATERCGTWQFAG